MDESALGIVYHKAHRLFHSAPQGWKVGQLFVVDQNIVLRACQIAEERMIEKLLQSLLGFRQIHVANDVCRQRLMVSTKLLKDDRSQV